MANKVKKPEATAHKSRMKKYRTWAHTTTGVLAAVFGLATSMASSLTTVGVVALLQRYVTIEIIFGLIAPAGAIVAALLGWYFSVERQEQKEEVQELD